MDCPEDTLARQYLNNNAEGGFWQVWHKLSSCCHMLLKGTGHQDLAEQLYLSIVC